MPRVKKPNPELRKELGTCLEALQFIERLEKKGNKTGRLRNTRRGIADIWNWYVTYKEKDGKGI